MEILKNRAIAKLKNGCFSDPPESYKAIEACMYGSQKVDYKSADISTRDESLELFCTSSALVDGPETPISTLKAIFIPEGESRPAATSANLSRILEHFRIHPLVYERSRPDGIYYSGKTHEKAFALGFTYLRCLWSFDTKALDLKVVFFIFQSEIAAVFDEMLEYVKLGFLDCPQLPAFAISGPVWRSIERSYWKGSGTVPDLQDRFFHVEIGDRFPDALKQTQPLAGVTARLIAHKPVFSNHQDVLNELVQETMWSEWAKDCPESQRSLQKSHFIELKEVGQILRKDVENVEQDCLNRLEQARNIMALLNNQIAREDVQASLALAEAAKQDTSSMKTVAIVTMAFLPGTFFSALFAIPSLQWNGESVIGSRFWVYWAFTLPSTAFVFLLWLEITKWKSIAKAWSKRSKLHLPKLQGRSSRDEEVKIDPATGADSSGGHEQWANKV